MRQYVLNVIQPDGNPPADLDLAGIMKRVGQWRDELVAAGAWVFTGLLAPAESATVVRAGGNGETVSTDGPFAEGKEHVGGFTIIQVADLDEAMAWTDKFIAITGLAVEIRPMATVDDVAARGRS
jgi:hypothetical protein